MKFSKALDRYQPPLGCDPEFFFQIEGRTIGSEKIIDLKTGLPVPKGGYGSACYTAGTSKLIVDGVQAEINPRPDTCRARLANEMKLCFKTLSEKMQNHKGVTASFIPLASVDKDELNTLDKSSQVFGCAPSKNAAGESGIAAKSVDPSEYKYRSAGGHIHIGRLGYASNCDSAISAPDRLVPIFDVLVGNTCVLLDRDPGNIERRKVYGRAGEYRTPSHGIEYRTLSNFWLRAYPLMSFVMSMSRFCVEVVSTTFTTQEYENELLKLVDMEDVRRAINENDFDLALSNFNKIKPFIMAAAYAGNDHHPLHANNMEDFEYFVSKGIDYWFKHDVVSHWANLPEAHDGGWESFLQKKVRPERVKEQAAEVAMGVKSSTGIVPPPAVKAATPVIEVVKAVVEAEAPAAPKKRKIIKRTATALGVKKTTTKKVLAKALAVGETPVAVRRVTRRKIVT